MFIRLLPLIACTLLGPMTLQAQELPPREKRLADAVNQSVLQAGLQYKAGKYEEAGKSIKVAMTQIRAAIKTGSPELYDAMVPAIQRVEKAHAMLEFEGVSLPPFSRPSRPVPGGGSARIDLPQSGHGLRPIAGGLFRS